MQLVFCLVIIFLNMKNIFHFLVFINNFLGLVLFCLSALFYLLSGEGDGKKMLFITIYENNDILCYKCHGD
ncbi:hypothetical protein A3N42_19265 [Klebsiella aerogenes]|nr:hypothetical protein A3N42_19265 [Klebsiella aerogenes]